MNRREFGKQSAGMVAVAGGLAAMTKKEARSQEETRGLHASTATGLKIGQEFVIGSETFRVASLNSLYGFTAILHVKAKREPKIGDKVLCRWRACSDGFESEITGICKTVGKDKRTGKDWKTTEYYCLSPKNEHDPICSSWVFRPDQIEVIA